jgi:hypothetical protein
VAGSYPAGDYPKTVTIKTTSSGATMRYTTNGTAPTESVGTLINGTSGTASVPAGATLKAIAYGGAYSDSTVASGVYTGQKVLTPSFSPFQADGWNVYPATIINITISTATSGATIYYTNDGSDPDTGSLHINASSGTISTGTLGYRTFKAMAVKSNCPNSDISGAYYYREADDPTPSPTPLPKCVTPTFNPVGAPYPAGDYPKAITLQTTTSGAVIYYTTNGIDPTHSSAKINGTSGTVNASSGQTIKAIASKPATNTDSEVASSGKYTTAGVVDTPALDEASYTGCDSAPVTVAMTTNTTGATIRWTVGSTPPSKTYGNIYSAPIKITPTTTGVTLRAMAYKTGMTDSAMATGTYELWPASDCGGGGGNQSEQPPEENGTTTTPVYGANGNLTTGLDGSTYTYDSMNRLTSASNGGVTVNYYYDGLNRQVARTVNGAAIYSVYDG